MKKRLPPETVRRLALEPRIVFDAAIAESVAAAVADAALPHALSPSSVSTREDTSFSFTGASQIGVSLADLGQSGYTGSTDNHVILSVSHGLLSANGVGTASTLVFSGDEVTLNSIIATLQYEPAADYNGTDTLTGLLQIPSGGPLLSFGSTLIAIKPVADIVADSIEALAATPVRFNVFNANPAEPDNFEDPGRHVTSVSQLSQPNAGVLNWDFNGTGNGAMRFTPKPGFSGTVTFDYTVTSGGVTETATVTITVAPAVNLAPEQTVPSAIGAVEDTALSINGITVADKDSASVTTTVSVQHGTVSASGSGGTLAGNGTSSLTVSGTVAQVNSALASLSYSSVADYNGADMLTLNTGDGTSNVIDTVAIEVAPVPDIVGDTLVTNQDIAVTANLLTGINGASADNFEGLPVITAVTQGAHGTVAIGVGGNVTYTPSANYSGADGFTYTVSSGGVTETTSVAVTVNATAPPAVTLINTDEDTTFSFTGADQFSVSFAQLGWSGYAGSTGSTITLAVAHGSLAIAGGASGSTLSLMGNEAALNAALATLQYTPAADFNGADTLTGVLQLASGAGMLNFASVDLHVAPVSDIVADALATDQNMAITANLITGTNGASADNFEGAPVITSVTQGAHGSVAVGAGGNVTYTPDANFSGTDGFTYTVTSGGVTETADVTVSVKPAIVEPVNSPPGNNAPAAVAATEDVPFSFFGASQVSVTDIDNNITSVQLGVAHGALTVTPAGSATIFVGANGSVTLTLIGNQSDINASLASLTYVPGADFNGSDTLAILTKDAANATATSSVAITVAPVADIVADKLTTNEGTAVTANLIVGTNGASADNFEASPVVTSVTQGQHGSVAVGAGGHVTYTPNANFVGTDSFSYTVISGGVSEVATVTVDVKPNPPPARLSPGFERRAIGQRPAAEISPQSRVLSVQDAVRGEPAPFDPALFIQPVVRASQAQAQLLARDIVDARVAAMHEALFDPFSLSAPNTQFTSPVQQAQQDAERADGNASAGAQARAGDAKVEVGAPVAAAAARPVASSFSSQLRRAGQTLRTAAGRDDAPAKRANPARR
ncbi:S-layer family protein [Caenimonas koreensis]|uniref:Tandem-95 repeat protein n=1 Tax=Caenimonas koreensis DSM 17982 TaxID=1121255 RepID=A0A844ATR1_9BURK|nr:tandem-95 repeat protein [Caenimonas koreensis]MRD47860.1 tandem-95 repeat protein [Caenimonas koreensis DSM 17982]